MSRALDADGQGGAEIGRLARPINRDRLSATVAKVKGVLVSGDALNLHLVGEFASGWVELPVTDKGVVRGSQRTRRQACTQQQLKSTLEHCCSPLSPVHSGTR
jgi:hypothetical protein